jgi:LuxR family quorum sensing-dependent transcriptional regulator
VPDFKLADYIERIKSTRTPKEALEVLHKPLGSIEADSIVVSQLYRPGKSLEEVFLLDSLPEEFRAFVKTVPTHDAALRRVRETIHPFVWRNVIPTDRETEWIKIVSVAEDCKTADGIMIPIPGVSGPLGHMWFGGSNLERRIPALQTISYYAFHHVEQLTGKTANNNIQLSMRERDILTWLSKGKTAWEIGEILSISQRTVEWHIRNAARKLNAVNTLQAVVKATKSGLIPI